MKAFAARPSAIVHPLHRPTVVRVIAAMKVVAGIIYASRKMVLPYKVLWNFRNIFRIPLISKSYTLMLLSYHIFISMKKPDREAGLVWRVLLYLYRMAIRIFSVLERTVERSFSASVCSFAVIAGTPTFSLTISSVRARTLLLVGAQRKLFRP